MFFIFLLWNSKIINRFQNDKNRMKFVKIIITPKEISMILGCTERNARTYMQDMRAFFGKEERHKKITFKEFSKYSGIDLEELEAFRS